MISKDQSEKAGSRKPAHSRAGEYLLYAMGEILLVVIGILIAIQIDDWNQERIDKKALYEHLGKIRTHTLQDSYKLDSITMGRRYISGLCKQARVRILDKTEDEDLILFMQCGAAFADFSFKPNTGGYESLKNSPYFGRINNTPLDSLLTQYNRLLDDLAQNERSYNEFVVGQEAYLSTQFDLSLILASAFVPQDSLMKRATPQSEYTEVFKAYTASAPYRNVISLAAWQLDQMIKQYDQLKETGQKVIDEIDAITRE